MLGHGQALFITVSVALVLPSKISKGEFRCRQPSKCLALTQLSTSEFRASPSPANDDMTSTDAKGTASARSFRPQRRRSIKTGTWLPNEDERLREAVAQHGTRWVVVASDVGSRSGDQCAKRWNENLDPKLDHSAWSPDEIIVVINLIDLGPVILTLSSQEQKLLEHVSIYGHNWKFIADSFFEGRAPLALRNRFSLLKRRSRRGPGRQSPRSCASQFDWDWYPSSGTVTPSTGNMTPSTRSPVDLNALSMENQTGLAQMPACEPMDFMSSTNLTKSDPAGTSLPATKPRSGTWPRSPFGSLADLSTGTFESPEIFGSDAQVIGFDMLPEGHARDPWTATGDRQADVAVPAPSERSKGRASLAGSEYSVTCQRKRLRTAVDHLVNAAMSDSVGESGGDGLVTCSISISG